MTIQLDIDFDEFEKWLTPERMENALFNAGYEVELKDEYKFSKVESENNPKGFQIKGDSKIKHNNFIIIPHLKVQFKVTQNYNNNNGAA